MGIPFPGRSIINKKGDGSTVKESTDSSTTIEDDDVKGKSSAPLSLSLSDRLGYLESKDGSARIPLNGAAGLTSTSPVSCKL